MLRETSTESTLQDDAGSSLLTRDRVGTSDTLAESVTAEDACGTSHGPACKNTPPSRCGKEAGHFGEHYCGDCGTVFT